MTYQQILYDIKDRVLTITLNRPDQLNTWTLDVMLGELISAFDRADADDEVRAIIMTGAGRAFCAGADLASAGNAFKYDDKGLDADFTANRDQGGQFALRIFNCLKPVIAAVNGAAVGVGSSMILPMDIRIASEKARFGFVFTRRGIIPEACSNWFLPRVVGIGQALEWTYSGRVFSAEEALKGGLIRSIHPPEELLDAARSIAREIANNTSAVSIALTRQMMWRMLGAGHPMEAHQLESRGMYYTGKSEDVKEGITSFLEKRPPKFTDKPSTDMPKFFPWWKDEPFQ
jgi:enoyl-CoA hydratase/carnithine racemase